MLERTQAQARADVKYGIHFAEMNENLWRRLGTLLNFICAIGGTVTFAGLIASSQWMSAMAGLIVAVASVLQLVLHPVERSMGFRDAKRELLKIDDRSYKMALHEIDGEINRVSAEYPVGWKVVAMPAYNAMVREIGHEDKVRDLTRFQRLVAALA